MPDRLPPRPAPPEETITLLRRPKSGFVVYPKYIPKRMVDGRARFMTKCDMLVGPCACGYTHNEYDGWVRETLQYQNLRFEPLILWGEKQQRGMVVEIPAYWKECRNWQRSRCDVLVGQCTCGHIHSIQENWVKEQLNRHGAVILNLPQLEGADVSESPPRPNSQSQLSRMRGGVVDIRPNHQAEDRTHRIGTPSSNGSWWGDDETESQRGTFSQSTPDVDVTSYEDWALPIELQEGVDNADGAMVGCDCTTCTTRREVERQGALQEWVKTSQMIRDSQDPSDADAWSRDNCNEAGQAPLFCDCADCCATRLRLRSQDTENTCQSVPQLVLSNQSRYGFTVSLGEDESTELRSIIADIAHARSDGLTWSDAISDNE